MTAKDVLQCLVAVLVALMFIFGFQVFLLTKMSKAINERDELIDYWAHKSDSLLKENMTLTDRYWDLKDSLIMEKYKEE